MGEVLIVLFASLSFLFLPVQPLLPLTAVQLLWINLLTDGFPALALGVDKAGKDIMKTGKRRDKILEKRLLFAIVQTGGLMTASLLGLFFYLLLQGTPAAEVQTMIFTGVVLFEFLILQTVEMHYKQQMWTNKYLLLAIIASIGLQLVVLYVPFLDVLFDTIPLGLNNWILLIGVLAASSIANYIITKIVWK